MPMSEDVDLISTVAPDNSIGSFGSVESTILLNTVLLLLVNPMAKAFVTHSPIELSVLIIVSLPPFFT